MIDYSKIPAELKSLPDWTTWQFVPRPGKKPEKKPNVPPSQWTNGKLYSFDAVLREFDRCQLQNDSKADGIGIVFHENNSIIGIDIDNISDNEAETDPIIKSLLTVGRAGYIERSVSGGGFHLIGTCSNKKILIDLLKSYNGKSGARTAKIELYINKRFFTVSGHAICSNFGNIDIAALIALEHITNKPILCSIASIINNSSIATEPKPAPCQCNINNTPTPALATIPPPPDTFSDEEVLKLPLRPIKETIKFMYKTKPILKNILEKDGFVLAPDYWKVYGRNNPKKDTSPSGFDQEIASVVIFWLYRYGVGKIIEILSESKLNRDKPLADYWVRTVSGAYERAIEFFPATYLGKLSWTEQQKLKNWQNWKKEMAKQER